jgi:MFS family permease
LAHSHTWAFPGDNGTVTSLGLTFRALRSRNYRLFFAGQSVSLIGTWMTRVATSWLVYRLTGSATLLGIVSFAGQIPAFFLAPLAGVWVDRWDRHRTLVATQVLSMVQSFALAVLALSHIITIGEVIWLSLFQGVINSFDMPARQSFVVHMVEDRADLGNAIALNSSMVNGARLVGPAVAGLLIAAVGEGWCFLIDGISYLAVIASLLMMTMAVTQARRPARRVLTEMQEGWSYVVRSVPIRSILLLLGLVSLVGMPYRVLLPILAAKVLHGGANAFGFLMAATGVGALAGAVTLAMRRTVLGLGRNIVVATALFGASLVCVAASRSFWLSLAILTLTGFGMMQQMASSNTILQTIVEDEKRGRVMAFYSMAFLGMTPFGSLLAGVLASWIGAPETLLISGVVTLAAGAWFARRLPAIRAAVRPIYVSLGILPEVAAGIQQVSSLETPPES